MAAIAWAEVASRETATYSGVMIPPALSGVVPGQLADLGRVLGLHPDEDLGGVLRRQLLDDVRGVVGVHLAEQLAGLRRRQGAQDARRLERRQLLEDRARSPRRAATG